MYAILLLILVAEINSVSYKGYKVYEILPHTAHQHYILEIWQLHYEFDFWVKSIRQDKKWVLMLPPNITKKFENFMKGNNITYYNIIDNVEKALQYKKIYSKNLNKKIFNHYNDYNGINMYLRNIAEIYNNTNLLTIGETYENRKILGLKIFNENKTDNPSILITAGMIGREWIGIATALYFIDQIIKNPDNKYLYEDVDWYIIPLLNPDGYEYTQKTDRLWQKNRSANKTCIGVNISKNFKFHWGESSSGTINQCSNKYIGPKPFSEKESEAILKFMETNSKNIKLYLSLRAFGPLILYPWAYTKYSVRNWKELETLGNKVASEIFEKRGTKYKVDSYISAKYAAGGTDIDWIKGKMNISLAYSLHMPSGKNNFFDPSVSEIEQIVAEIFSGISVFHNYIATNN